VIGGTPQPAPRGPRICGLSRRLSTFGTVAEWLHQPECRNGDICGVTTTDERSTHDRTSEER
jgi:hypothetical protein